VLRSRVPYARRSVARMQRIGETNAWASAKARRRYAGDCKGPAFRVPYLGFGDGVPENAQSIQCERHAILGNLISKKGFLQLNNIQ